MDPSKFAPIEWTQPKRTPRRRMSAHGPSADIAGSPARMSLHCQVSMRADQVHLVRELDFDVGQLVAAVESMTATLHPKGYDESMAVAVIVMTMRRRPDDDALRGAVAYLISFRPWLAWCRSLDVSIVESEARYHWLMQPVT
jgi:hypothetical protein